MLISVTNGGPSPSLVWHTVSKIPWKESLTFTLLWLPPGCLLSKLLRSNKGRYLYSVFAKCGYQYLLMQLPRQWYWMLRPLSIQWVLPNKSLIAFKEISTEPSYYRIFHHIPLPSTCYLSQTTATLGHFLHLSIQQFLWTPPVIEKRKSKGFYFTTAIPP